jgi:hypothetical protein
LSPRGNESRELLLRKFLHLKSIDLATVVLTGNKRVDPMLSTFASPNKHYEGETMKVRLVLVAATFALTACGGGGDSPPAPTPVPIPTVPAPEGVHIGTASTGYELNILNLENGSVWGIYGRTINGVLLVSGLIQANGTYNNGSFAASDGRDYFWDGTVTAGTVSASYNAAGAFNGSVTYAGGAATFTTNLSNQNYDYNRAANLAELAGTWTGSTVNGAGSTIAISASGGVAGSSSGCAILGTAVPRPSGKNVFNITVTFANSPACSDPGTTATGIAITYPLANGTRQILVGIQNASRSKGTAFMAIR